MNYNFNFNTFAENIVPTKHRLPKMLAWFYVIVKPLQWLRDCFFDYTVDGLIYDNFDISTNYTVGTVVKNFYLNAGTFEGNGDLAIYICVQNTTGETCDNVDFWYKICDDSIGLSKYNLIDSKVILLEWALNNVFNTTQIPLTFRQPATGLRSDIYIETKTVQNPFFVGYIEAESGSAVYENGEAIDFVGNENPTAAGVPFDYIVWVPQNLYDGMDAMSTSTDIAKTQVSKIVDKFNLGGMKYDVQPY